MIATTSSRANVISIKRVTLHRVRVPLIEPFRISNGVVTDKDAILIEVVASDNLVGWGEASPMAGTFYSGDTPQTVWSSLATSLIPDVCSLGEVDVLRFYERLRKEPADPFAKAGIEGALWDACAHAQNVPLWQLLGGRSRPIPSGVAIGIYDEIEDLLERVQRYTTEGYQRVKIKIQPGWDIEPVSALRERFPRLPLMVDANAAYSLNDLEVFRELDKYNLIMIEQPLATEAIEDSGELQRQLQTPLCVDESAESLEVLKSVIEHQAARIINIKVQRVGGLSEAMLMLNAARAARLECWVGTMPELGIASAQGLHFATLDGLTYPTDIEASKRWYVDDVIEPGIEIDSRGFIRIPSGPGSGYNVSRAKLKQYTVDAVTFEN